MEFKNRKYDNVSILNGGLELVTLKAKHKITPSNFKVKLNDKYVVSYKDVRNAKKKTVMHNWMQDLKLSWRKKHTQRAGTIPTAVNLEEAIIVDGNLK